MKFLVDNQLPPALASFISKYLGAEALHVADVRLQEASDLEVWNYASAQGLILISKDEDFLNLLSKSPTAKLLWVRLGNCRRLQLFDGFQRLWPKILERFASGDRLVEIR
ncbi:MAG: DUF5615 family PIN-like protein [Bryobacteraceae bacterium]